MTRTGGCRCGAIRFEARGEPLLKEKCFCASCRRATGSLVAFFADYPSAEVAMVGTPALYASSPGVRRGFCGVCGSPLFWRSEDRLEKISLLVGAFDAPETLPPQSDSYPEEKPAWLCVTAAP